MYNPYSNYSPSYIAESFYYILGGVIAVFAFFAVVLYVVSSIAYMKIFEKAGIDKWKAWVPYYRDWIFLELGGYNGALSLISLAGSVPYVGLFAWIACFAIFCLAANEISKKLGKENSFMLYPLGVVTLGITTLIWYFSVASGDTVWNDSLGKPSLAKGTIIGYQIVREEVVTEKVQEETTQE